MTISKEDLLRLAQELVTGDTEVHWRSAGSRAYYAAYHGCMTWHAALPMPGSNDGLLGGVHQKLINQLRNAAPECSEDDKGLSRVLSAQLNAFRIRRHIADYQLTEPFDQVSAIGICSQVKNLLDKL